MHGEGCGAANVNAELSPSLLQVWEAEPDEKKYWMTIDQINQLPEDERKRFWNWAYEVDEGVWSSKSCTARSPHPAHPMAGLHLMHESDPLQVSATGRRATRASS